MKLHPRYQRVARARNALSEFVFEQLSGDLTVVEAVGNLLAVAQDVQRLALRIERHDTDEKKANEE